MTTDSVVSQGALYNHDLAPTDAKARTWTCATTPASKPLATLALLMLLPAVALATTRHVTNLNDAGAGSLRETIALSVNGDLVALDGSLILKTITLTTGELLVSQNITIDATGETISVSGNKASRVLHVAAGASVTVNGLTLREGASTSGGCLYNQGSLTLNGVTIEECVATAGGGGIRNDAVLTVNGSTISDNTALGSFGGGIDNVFGGATLTLVNSTVSGNFASGNGGGIDNFGAGATASLVASTVAYNRAGGVGGGIHGSGGAASAVSLQQSLVANNGAPTSPDCSGTLSSADYNLVTSLTGCTLSGPATHDLIAQDPKLGALQLNGIAPRTHALRPLSAAMDAIPLEDCARSVDSRNLARPQDGDGATASCDIGAYEARTPIVVDSLLDPTDPGLCTLRDALFAANTNAPQEGCAAGGAADAGARIVFAVTGRINLTGSPLFASKGVMVDGPGADRLTVSAERASSVFEFAGVFEDDANQGYQLAGLTIANGLSNYGGGVYFSESGRGRLAIDRVAFEDNVATSGGGGLYLSSLLTGQEGVEVDNSTFSNTLARSSGEEIYAIQTSMRITNSTIGETRSDGAIAIYSDENPGALARVRLIDSTVVGSEEVGVFVNGLGPDAGSASIEYRNSIFAGHGAELVSWGTAVLKSSGYNIIDDDSGPPAATGDLKNTDPKVALHLYGGGPTRTIAPLPGSPAIDHVPLASCGAFFDQRGAPRPLDGDRTAATLCDAGAFETAPPIVVNSLLDPSDPGKCTLRDAITAANTNAAAGGCPAGLATAPDLVTFSVNGTIPLGAELHPTGSVAIRGPGASKLKIDGQGATNAFWFGIKGGDYTLTGLSVENGFDPEDLTGGVYANPYRTISVAEALLRNNRKGSFKAVGAGPVQLLRSTITVDTGIDISSLAEVDSGSAVLESCTLSDPAPVGLLDTDALVAFNGANVLLKGTTVNGVGTYGIRGFDSRVLLANSIVAHHDFDIDASTVVSWDHNLSTDGNLSGMGDLLNTEPLLSPLATTYGELPVFEPLPGSPAWLSVPNQNCGQAFDERGIPRPPANGCSIGAAEPLGNFIFSDGFESP